MNGNSYHIIVHKIQKKDIPACNLQSPNSTQFTNTNNYKHFLKQPHLFDFSYMHCASDITGSCIPVVQLFLFPIFIYSYCFCQYKS